MYRPVAKRRRDSEEIELTSFANNAENPSENIDDLERLIEMEEIETDQEDIDEDGFASVAPTTDDPNTNTFTLRMVTLGVFWAAVLSISNTVFTFRKNPFSVPTTIVVLLAYPMGKFLELLPNRNILGVSINPGPFSVKEHVLIVLMAAAGGSKPYGIDNNDTRVNFWNSLAWVLSSQMIGFGLAGICRRFLVKPTSMIWPTCLPDIALYTSFHSDKSKETSTGLSRYQFFWIFFGGMVAYHWIPGHYAPTLSLISVLCILFKDRNILLMGSGDAFEGPGILSFTFDWSIISGKAPLVVPFWTSVNTFVQSIFWGWIFLPLIYFFNTFKSPILESFYGWEGKPASVDPFPSLNSNFIYDKFGNRTDPSNFLAFPTLKLNETLYEEHAPFYLSPAFAIDYLTSFMNIASVISYVYLWHGDTIFRQAKAAFSSIDPVYTDVHNRIMKTYQDIPDWMYLAWFIVFTVIQVLVCHFTPFQMPIWATFFAVFLGSILTIPIGVIQAISGSQMGLNVLTEFVIGLLIPGETVAVMTFKSLGYNVMIQALMLTRDLKIAHYMHISPVAMVVSQLIGSVVGAVLNTGTVFGVLSLMKEQLAEPGGEWSATSYRTFSTAGGIWGAIGPARFFGPESPYFALILGFPIGFLLPIIPWLLNKRWPSSLWKLIHIPLLTQGLHVGQNQAATLSAFFVAFLSHRYIKKYHFAWWSKYNYILSCALDSGVAIATLMIVSWNQHGAMTPIDPSILNPTTNPDYYCRGAAFDS